MGDPYTSVLITGGNGMLACALRSALEQRGLAYVAVDLPQHDITQEATVAELFLQHRPTLLLNCAAHTKVDLCEQEEQKANAINGHAVGLLARFAAQYGTQLVHLSTDFVFDGKSMRPYRPEDPPNPLSAYGRSKLLGEQQIQQIDPPRWIIARTAWLYGPKGASFPRTIVERARAGQVLRVVDDQIGSPTYAHDLAAGLLALVDRQVSGLFHVTNGSSTSWYHFATAIVKEFGLNADLQPTTTAQYLQLRPNQAPRPAYSVLDNSDFVVAVGQGLRPWRDALHSYRQLVEPNAR